MQNLQYAQPTLSQLFCIFGNRMWLRWLLSLNIKYMNIINFLYSG